MQREEFVDPEDLLRIQRAQEESARRQAEEAEMARLREEIRPIVERFATKSLEALQVTNPEAADKIKQALQEGRISALEALIMSELAQKESWDNTTLAINAVRSKDVGRNEELYFDDGGILQGMEYQVEPVGDGQERRVYRPRYLTTALEIDPSGNVVLDADQTIISREEIENAHRTSPITGLADPRLGLLSIQQSQLWQSVVAVNTELGTPYNIRTYGKDRFSSLD